MEKHTAYSQIAPFFEYSVTRSCDYSAWAEYLIKKVREYSPQKNGLDVASGSGYFTRALKKAGFDVVGVDSSEEMLSEAEKKCREEKLSIEFRRSKMQSLKCFEKVGFITAVNDGINYLPPKDLIKTFANFYKLLVKNGALLFDLSSAYKLKNIIGSNTFCEDDEKYSYIWFNKLIGELVEMELCVFTEQENGLFRKSVEKHVQYIYTKEQIETALTKCGFSVIEATAPLGEPLKNDSERVVFVAIKK